MYPVNLDITDKFCVIVGGGNVAERKIQGLLSAGAQVRVISPHLTPTLRRLEAAGEIDWVDRGYQDGDLTDAFMVFAATDNPGVQEKIVQAANVAGKLINVIDQPALCTFQVPASITRGDLIITVSTNGKSPAVASMVRRQLETMYGSEYAVLLTLMSDVRDYLLQYRESSAERKELIQNVLHEDIVLWIKTGQWERLQNHLQCVLGVDLDFGSPCPGDEV